MEAAYGEGGGEGDSIRWKQFRGNGRPLMVVGGGEGGGAYPDPGKSSTRGMESDQYMRKQ